MEKDYTRGLRALEEVLLSKGRLSLDHKKLSKKVINRMVKSAHNKNNVTKSHLKRIIKKMRGKIVRIAKRVTKKTATKAEAKGKTA